MKEERYALSTVQFKPSVAAAITVVLQRDNNNNDNKYLFGANIYMNIFRFALQVTNPPNPTQGRTSITQ